MFLYTILGLFEQRSDAMWLVSRRCKQAGGVQYQEFDGDCDHEYNIEVFGAEIDKEDRIC